MILNPIFLKFADKFNVITGYITTFSFIDNEYHN